MGAIDISYKQLAIGLTLLLIPAIIVLKLKLFILKNILISALRMTLQLILVGIFLKYIFALNNPLLNFCWFIVMIFFASLSTIQNSKLNVKLLFIPIFLAISLANVVVLLYFNYVIIGLTNIFDAKYIIAIGGMLLGNSLRANVIGLGNFYSSIKTNENKYQYSVAMGATRFESIRPFLQHSMQASLAPSLASMATMGIVSIPGMMTGQILGGSSPMVAVKYQIAIVIAIFASLSLSTLLSVLFSSPAGFHRDGLMNKNILK